MNVPALHTTESLERLLHHIRLSQRPEQMTIKYLRNQGFVSGHDPELRLLLRLLGFLRQDDTPTDRWELYKSDGDKVLQGAIKECYAGLFKEHPDAAFEQDKTKLEPWFSQHTTSGAKSSTTRAIRTFRKLVSLSGMSSPRQTNQIEIIPAPAQTDSREQSTQREVINYPRLFQLPPDATEEQYKKMYRAMRSVYYED